MSTPDNSHKPNKERFYESSYFILILITATVCIGYFNTLNFPLIFDDYSTLVENMSIRSLYHFSAIIANPTQMGLGWRPFANFTFALSYALSGLDPWGHHCVNIILHIITAWILFHVVRLTLKQSGIYKEFYRDSFLISVAISLLWVIHPVLTQTVTYISQRTETLMALMYLLTLYCFIRGSMRNNSVWYCASIITCFLGTMCKEVIVTAPVVVLLYDRFIITGSFKKAFKTRGLYYCGLVSTWLCLAFFLRVIQHQAVGFGMGISPYTYALTECKAVTTYLRLSYFPYPLIFDRGPLFIHSLSDALPYGCILITLLTATIWLIIKRPYLGFICSCFFIILSPSSSIVPVAEVPIAENRVYLPLTLALTLGVLALYYYLRRKYASIIASIIILLFIALTFNRNQIYSSDILVWQDSAEKIPENARAHNNLGLLLYNTPSRINESRAQFEMAIKINPFYSDAHNNLALYLANQTSEKAEAIKHYELALKFNSNNAEAHDNLANLLGKDPTRIAEAKKHIEQALALKPYSAEFHNNYAVLLVLDKSTQDEAIKHYKEAIRLKPSYAEAHNNLANILTTLPSKEQEAYEHYMQAIALIPNSGELHYNFALFLKQFPKFTIGSSSLERAADHFSEALRLGIWPNPKDRAYQELNVADLLNQIPSRKLDALKHYQNALSAGDPDAVIHFNYAQCLESTPNPDWAKIKYHYETVLKLNPQSLEAHKALGRIYSTNSDTLDLGISHYKQALTIDPNSVYCHNNLGLLLSLSSETKNEAELHFKAALKLDPKNAETHNNYGALLATINGRTNEAIISYKQAIADKPHFAEAHNNLANILSLYPERRREAIEQYTLALEDLPHSYAIHYNLALQLEKIPGEKSAALAHYKEALKYKSDFKAAQEAINRLK